MDVALTSTTAQPADAWIYVPIYLPYNHPYSVFCVPEC